VWPLDCWGLKRHSIWNLACENILKCNKVVPRWGKIPDVLPDRRLSHCTRPLGLGQGTYALRSRLSLAKENYHRFRFSFESFKKLVAGDETVVITSFNSNWDIRNNTDIPNLFSTNHCHKFQPPSAAGNRSPACHLPVAVVLWVKQVWQ